MTAEPKDMMMRFLLGEMPAEESARFEDEYIKNPEFFQRLVELENDLLDLCAIGALTQSEQERLERSFLADPDRQRRLTFARTVANSLGDAAPNVSGEPSKPGIPPRWYLSARAARLRVAAVVLVAMLAGISWLLVTNHELRTELESLQKQHIAVLKSSAELRQQVDALNQELRSRSESAKPRAGNAALNEKLVFFTLKADLLRGGGEIPRIVIPSTASIVALRLVFPADSFPGYNLSIETANGTPVWHQDAIQGRPAGVNSKAIVVRLPASAFRRGDYVARITSRSAIAEDVAGYSFSVATR